ncbi:MAG: hypothetical protein ACTSO9_05555 [Candidatus Helarchaeota archaeon]
MENERIISIISIILGVLGIIVPLITFFIPCFIALILGFYAYSKDDNLGLIGVTLGCVGIVINALMLAYIIPPYYGIISL